MTEELLNKIQGGPELLQWFSGRVPSFHDAEVLGLILDRDAATASLRVHGFEMTSEVDSNGYFVCTRHVVVTFALRGVVGLELDDFNHQNALMGLSISQIENDCLRLELEPACGLGGFIDAQNLTISLEPGIPPGSIYLPRATN